jgi:GMP synthase-like glutamine amidotransferase
MSIVVLDLHRRDATAAVPIVNQLAQHTPTTVLRVFSPDFAHDRVSTADGLVLSGVDDMRVYADPAIRRLAPALRHLSNEGRHVLGICGGNQVLAKTYGYRRYTLPDPEVGWRPITLTTRGRADPLFRGLDGRFLAFEQHILAVRCDDRARILADNERGVQAIRYHPTVRGLQFHPEHPPAGGRECLQTPQRHGAAGETGQAPETRGASVIFANFAEMVKFGVNTERVRRCTNDPSHRTPNNA